MFTLYDLFRLNQFLKSIVIGSSAYLFLFFLYMASKTVTIKPEFFQTSKRKSKRKVTDQVVIKPTNLREILLNKLIERRKTQKVKMDPPILNEVSFDRMQEPVPVPVATCVVQDIPGQDKPYGILKNGTKPTFKTWNASSHVEPMATQPTPDQAPAQVAIPVCIEETVLLPQPVTETKALETEKIILGKNKKKKTVCVLIENNKTRKMHGERAQKIKKTSIQTVRNYLKNHNLIKSGSAAPNPLLRTLYENVLFCGDITNQNKENLIHNFSEKENTS